MKYRVSHTTLYEYALPVGLCYNEIRLVPRQLPGRQQCETFSLQIDPKPEDYRERRDFFGNLVAFFYLQEQHTRLQVSALSEVNIDIDQQRFSFAEESPWEEVLSRLREERSFAALDALQYAYDSPLAAGAGELGDYARVSFVSGRPLFEAARELMERIHADFTFDPHFTTLATPLSTVFAERRGVCQDFAHLMIACLRSLALPARYVSGYIETLPPAGKEKLVGSDASHAWCSVYHPGHGWVDFDPTNNQLAGEQHIVLAWGRDFSDVTPVKGMIYGGGQHELSVSVDVSRI